MHPPEIKEQAQKWLKTSITIREPKSKAALCRKLGITPSTLHNWELELRNGHKDKVDKVIDQLAGFDDLEIARFVRQVYDRAMEVGASAKHMELFARLQGLLIDKSETKVKIGFDASDIARIRNEARRELETEGYTVIGSGEVRQRPPVFSEKIRED